MNEVTIWRPLGVIKMENELGEERRWGENVEFFFFELAGGYKIILAFCMMAIGVWERIDHHVVGEE